MWLRNKSIVASSVKSIAVLSHLPPQAHSDAVVATSPHQSLRAAAAAAASATYAGSVVADCFLAKPLLVPPQGMPSLLLYHLPLRPFVEAQPLNL